MRRDGSPTHADDRQGGFTGRRGVVDELAAAIQARIMSGETPAGTRLKQAQLAAEYQLSRTPIREALRKLQAEGIVEVLPHQGAVVLGPTVRDIREAYELLAELEGMAAALAARSITRDQLDDLRDAERLYRTLGEETSQDGTPPTVDAWRHAGDVFHEAIRCAADNARLRKTILDLHKSFPRGLASRGAVELESRMLKETIEQHREVLEAIERGDAEEARRAMRGHVHRTGELVSRWVERRVDESG